MAEWITAGREVRDAVADGWELWHVCVDRSPLPGRWELRRGRQPSRPVHWDAIERVRQHYLPWFEEHTESIEIGRHSWCYRLKQRSLLPIAGGGNG